MMTEIEDLPFDKFVKKAKQNVNDIDPYNGLSLLQRVVLMQIDDERSSSDIIRKLAFLLENGADVNYTSKKTSKKKTALTLFCYAYWRPTVEHQNKVVKLLLEYGTDVNLQDEYGATALQYAISNNKLDTSDNKEMYIALLEAGSNYTLKDNFGNDLLYYCDYMDREDVIPLIEKYGKYPLNK